MAIVKPKKIVTEPKIKERLIARAVMNHFGGFFGHNEGFVNVEFEWSERDLLVVTQAGFAYEVEVKISLADWKKDQFKDKWHHSPTGMMTLPDGRQKYVGKLDRMKYIKKFYYAVPEKLIEKCPEFVPETAGLISIKWEDLRYWSGFQANVVRDAKAKKTEKLSERQMLRLFKKGHGKYYIRFINDMNKLEDPQTNLF